MHDDPLGDELTARGATARIETRGRISGRPVAATVGFVERPDGSLVVAAGDPRADWALNLLADPRCRVTIADHARDCRAGPLAGPTYAAAIRDLILKYGTPAERLGSGPAFELRPDRATA
jgi:deazaflavin-dependent oxidoreductase (nitroreductase family)